MDRMVRQQLGNYRLLRLLGRGGFAEVYLGEHIYLKSQAAIKVLHTQLASEDMQSFLQEAQTLVRLVHPHIIRVLDFGIEEETPFLVMDYASKGTLRQRHPKGARLPLPLIVEYVAQIADALHYAHQQKLIHRDIKPENMLLGRQDEVLLTDFGIATVAQSSRYQGAQDMAGTIAYMAPEQVQAHPRPASDQYALGVVVYEWLCGERPFHGSFTEVAAKHAFMAPPALRDYDASIPAEVEQVVLIALHKDPAQRFASIKAFAIALEQAAMSTPSQPASFYNTGTLRSVSPTPLVIPASQLPEASIFPPAASLLATSSSSSSSSVSSTSIQKNSVHTPPVSSRGLRSGPLPAPSTRVMAASEVTSWRALAGTEVSRSRKMFFVLLLVLGILLVSWLFSMALPLFAGHAAHHVKQATTSIVRIRATSTGGPDRQTPMATATTPVSAASSAPTGGITPSATATGTHYPVIGGYYTGSIHNIPANVTTSMALSLDQLETALSGEFTVGAGLRGSGPFTGSVDSNSEVIFTVHSSAVAAPLLFQGTVQPGGGLSGTYCSTNRFNRCDKHVGGYGTWNVTKQ